MISEKLQIINENLPKIYDAGKQSEYDKFWNNIQENGNRTNYNGVFMGIGWNANFNPKYCIKPIHASQMFLHSDITNITQEQIDSSNIITANYFAQYSRIETWPILNFQKNNNFYYIFHRSQLKYIEKFITKIPARFDGAFYSCHLLEHILFEGNIECTNDFGINLSDCKKIDKETITSLINCLSSTATSHTKCILSLESVATNFGDPSSSQEWQNLVNSKKNWTISLL